jgi:hypothetical protein
MKKIIILILTILSGQFSFAQYHPIVEEDRTWKMVNYGFVQFFYIEFIAGDTLVNNTIYHKLYSSNDIQSSDVYMVGMLREDVALQQVFFFDGTEEYLLYNFNVQVDDVLNTYGLGSLVPVTVSSIETVMVNGTSRKKINLHGEFYDTFWIEGVGGHNGLRDGAIGPVADYDPELMCYYEGNVLRWDDPDDGSTCGITLGLDAEQSNLPDIGIYPNPAQDRATLSVAALVLGQRATVCILNADGKMCSIEKIVCGQRNEIDLHSLHSGAYQVILRFDNGAYTCNRLIVMK